MKKINPLILIAFLLVCVFLIMFFSSKDDSSVELKDSAETLSRFGRRLEGIEQPSQNDISLVSSLAQTSIPLFKFIVNKAALATAINFDTNQSVVLNPITGDEVNACNTGGGRNKCTTQLLPPNDDVRTALSLKEPIEGELIKNGKRIKARYIVSVTAVYENTHCATHFAGSQSENCSTWP